MFRRRVVTRLNSVFRLRRTVQLLGDSLFSRVCYVQYKGRGTSVASRGEVIHFERLVIRSCKSRASLVVFCRKRVTFLPFLLGHFRVNEGVNHVNNFGQNRRHVGFLPFVTTGKFQIEIRYFVIRGRNILN